MKVITVFAQLAAGKDTVADYLATKLNNRLTLDYWKRIGFAHAVKKVFMDTFNVDWDFIEEWKRKDEIPEGFNIPVRQALQYIGDGFRQIQSDIWINTVFRNSYNVIISDGRYINEAKAVKEHNGFNILLYRKGFENNDPNPSESQIKPTVDWLAKTDISGAIHADDTPQDVHLFDYFLRNDGTLQELYSKIDNDLFPVILNWIGGHSNEI